MPFTATTPDTVLACTLLVWDRLTDHQKAVLHNLANFTHCITGTDVEKAASVLATEPGNCLHPDTCNAINHLAAEWHAAHNRR
jgi:hypothetical protein